MRLDSWILSNARIELLDFGLVIVHCERTHSRILDSRVDCVCVCVCLYYPIGILALFLFRKTVFRTGNANDASLWINGVCARGRVTTLSASYY